MSVAAGTASLAVVKRALEDEGARTRAALLEFLPGQVPRPDLYDVVADYPQRSGKAIRPALCLATCRAYGGRTEEALPAAVALELLHNAFLVHDDICDDAVMRRGDVALHVRHGVPLALTAGNALAWTALAPLLSNIDTLGPRLALDVLAEFDHMTRRTIEGQAVELGWRGQDLGGVDTDAYLRLVLAKTCWYSTIHPCRVGALIGSRRSADLEAVARFGFFLGAVLQVRDDIENVSDHDGVHGKDAGSDIVEGKPTLLLIHVLQAASPAERDELATLVGPGATPAVAPAERIARVVELLERHGSVDYACAFADGLAGAALAEFDAAMGHLPESADKDFLRSLVLYLRDPHVRGR